MMIRTIIIIILRRNRYVTIWDTFAVKISFRCNERRWRFGLGLLSIPMHTSSVNVAILSSSTLDINWKVRTIHDGWTIRRRFVNDFGPGFDIVKYFLRSIDWKFLNGQSECSNLSLVPMFLVIFSTYQRLCKYFTS